MADFIISTTIEKFEFAKRFGSGIFDILASEKIFISRKEVSSLRKVPTIFNIGSITQQPNEVNYKLTEGGSSSIHANEFRIGERIVGFDSSSKIIMYGIVQEIGVDLTVRVLYELGDLNNLSLINVPTDDYIDENRAIEIKTSDVPFLMMSSLSGGTIDISENTFVKKKIKIGAGGSGGGGDLYTNGTPTPTTIGGISAGTTFLNQTMQQMWDALLYPYQAPSFTSFVVSGNNPLEVGETLPANQTATWTTSSSGNVNPNSVDINNISPTFTNLVTGTANDGSEVLPQGAITYNTENTNTWQIKATNSQGSNFNRNYSKNWYWIMYYGEDANTTLDENGIKALRASLLTNDYTRNYAMQAGATYKYIAYPTSFGTATNFTDTSTGFAVAMEAPYTVSITNAYGVTTDYNVHRSTNILNSAITIAVS